MRTGLVALITAVLAGPALAEPLQLGIINAEQQFDAVSTEPVVYVRLTADSTKAFAAFTRDHLGEPIDFLVDGVVRMTPIIREPIVAGMLQISGVDTAQEAQELAIRLRSGEAEVVVMPRD